MVNDKLFVYTEHVLQWELTEQRIAWTNFSFFENKGVVSLLREKGAIFTGEENICFWKCAQFQVAFFFQQLREWGTKDRTEINASQDYYTD